MSFEQAAIKVEKAQEFARLQKAAELAFLQDKVETFLKQLDRKGIRVRDLEGVLKAKLLEGVAGESGLSALQVYRALPVSDQAQMREFYLSRIEQVDGAVRTKYRKVYRYY